MEFKEKIKGESKRHHKTPSKPSKSCESNSHTLPHRVEVIKLTQQS